MKNRLRSLLYGLGLSATMFACVTEYQPESLSIPPSLVVEGQITDQPGPYTVRLTRTANYSIRSINLLETGATVTIEDNRGNRETLREQSPGGVYVSRANGIQGVAGRSYRIVIQTKAGKRYESDAEVLQSAPPIQKLYTEYRNEPVPNSPVRKQSWKVYLDTKDPETTGNYYRWEWAHYEAISVCQKTLPRNSQVYIGIYCCTPCWDITRCFNCISVSSDADVNGKAISGQYIMSAPYTSTAPYYVEVQQQAISKGAYAFWRSVSQLVNSTGGLFDPAPSSVQGNLRCVSDPNELVYGYFGATGISEQYIYVDRSNGQGLPETDLPVNVPYPSTPACIECENSLYRTPNKPRWWVY
ncbi:DUF4249 domain-containing protein [Spirosoma taeanense]|uniref:DUF4249 domain-containing protein n=1 Tax=Spirosoma taeanense TaxID=2735870 RepID=A0A6M5YBN5_9BACT|nr:DUF4249 domain-containing protein [Spirosoma taeanense]QJW90690.1 DUF4249 domain-containing protein [Spirosoma taeanense]